MNKIFSITKKIWAFVINRTQKTNYYYLRYFSKKDNATTERIAEGYPKLSSKGTMLYNDVLRGSLRSFSLDSLCELRNLSKKEFEHYSKFLSINF